MRALFHSTWLGLTRVAALTSVVALTGVAAGQDAPTPAPSTDATPMLEPGSPVTANFRGEGRWFPAVVVERLPDDRFRVVYQDGWPEVLTRAQLDLDVLRPGIEVDAPRAQAYLRAKVLRRLDDVALVQFPDGQQDWRGVGQLGIPTAARDGEPYVSAEAPEPVLATWQGDTQWIYPGQVVASRDGQKHVVYQDGTDAWVPAAQVRAGSVQVDEQVGVRWPGTKTYAPAKVVRRVGPYAVLVEKPDGTQAWSALARLRVAAAF